MKAIPGEVIVRNVQATRDYGRKSKDGVNFRSDFYSSPEWEDVITVVASRDSVRHDLYRAPKEVKEFIKIHIEEFSRSEAFSQSIAGHLGNWGNPQEDALRILDILQNIE